MTVHQVRIDRDGNILAVYSDAIAPTLGFCGEATVSRASHVEPAPGGWSADLAPVGGPVLGPFVLRATALAAEVEWLNSHVV